MGDAQMTSKSKVTITIEGDSDAAVEKIQRAITDNVKVTVTAEAESEPAKTTSTPDRTLEKLLIRGAIVAVTGVDLGLF
jgi:hypothetical protein